MLTTLYYSAPLCTVKQSYKKYSYFPLFTQIFHYFVVYGHFGLLVKWSLFTVFPQMFLTKIAFQNIGVGLGMPDTPFSPPLMYSTPVCPITLLPLYIGEHRQIYLFICFLYFYATDEEKVYFWLEIFELKYYVFCLLTSGLERSQTFGKKMPGLVLAPLFVLSWKAGGRSSHYFSDLNHPHQPASTANTLGFLVSQFCISDF